MNWCKILGHKWHYDKQEIEILIEVKYIHQKKVLANTRLCKRCYKKQKASLGYGVYNFKLGKYCNWSDIELTQAEKREKNLKNIGI